MDSTRPASTLAVLKWSRHHLIHLLSRHKCMQVTLAGHRGAVTALRYNRAGALLASGAQDTDIIVWDVVAEAGLFRLRAHTGQVTDMVPPWHGCNYL